MLHILDAMREKRLDMVHAFNSSDVQVCKWVGWHAAEKSQL